MKIIGLFFPALISLKICLARDSGNSINIVLLLIRYGLYVLWDNWVTQLLITYVLGISDVTAEALNSVSFFTKYVVIAAGVAVLLPLCVELVKKYFKISVETGINDEENKEDKENN